LIGPRIRRLRRSAPAGEGGRSSRARPAVALVAADLSTGGGVNRVITDLAAILAGPLGCRVLVINARSRRPPSYALPGNVRLLSGRGPSLLSYCLLLLRLRRSGFACAVGFWTQDNILLALALAGSAVRSVVCEHTSYFHLPHRIRFLRRLAYPLARTLTVLNRRELDHYRPWFKDVRLVPNLVREPESGSGGGERERLIIGVGHLIPRKGFDDLIRAFSASGLAARGWKVAIIGTGPEEAALRRMAEALPPGAVEFVPPTPAIQQWYRRATLIAVPSRIEVFSLVLAEAALAGAIPVAYDADGPAFLLHDHPDLRVPIGDVEGLSGAMQKLAASEDLDQLRQEVARSIAGLTSPERIASLWAPIVHPAAAGPAGAA
jgi:glycosyltransferase involved in cell wall biosynthesis